MNLLTELAEARIARDAERGWARTRCTIEREWPLSKLIVHRQVFAGSAAVTIPAMRSTWIDRRTWPITPGMYARDYISLARSTWIPPKGSMPSKRIPFRGRQAKQLEGLVPAYYVSSDRIGAGPWAMVDVKSAYATLYLRAGGPDIAFDLWGATGPIFGRGRWYWPRVEEWSANKLARNAVVGMLWNRSIPYMSKGATKLMPNTTFAPDLVLYILTTMHAIATEAVELFGCVLWNVDGGIVRPEQAEPLRQWLWERWGLESTVKAEGYGWVWGLNQWMIGDKTTEHPRQGLAQQQTADTNSLIELTIRQRDFLAQIRGTA